MRLDFLVLSNLKKHSHAFAGGNLWKHGDKSRNCLWCSITPFATMLSTIFNNSTFIYFSILLSTYFQSFLQQICCIWERVKTCSPADSFCHICSRLVLKTLRQMEKFVIWWEQFFYRFCIFSLVWLKSDRESKTTI